MSRYESRRISAIIAAGGAAVLFVVFAVEGLWFDVAIIGIVGLVMGIFWWGTGMWAARVVRDVEALDEAQDELREPTDAMLAVDALEDAIHSASEVPFTDQVRLDRGKADRLLEPLRADLPRGSSKLTTLSYELDELIRRAKPIPLTDQIRLDRNEVYDIVDRMRASFAEER